MKTKFGDAMMEYLQELIAAEHAQKKMRQAKRKLMNTIEDQFGDDKKMVADLKRFFTKHIPTERRAEG